MSKEYTYVIVYKEGEGWSIDYESEEQFFPNGTIYDNEAKQWEHGYLGDGEFNGREEEITEMLSAALELSNGDSNDL
jgi:uncharacterized membrane-anchored protein